LNSFPPLDFGSMSIGSTERLFALKYGYIIPIKSFIKIIFSSMGSLRILSVEASLINAALKLMFESLRMFDLQLIMS